MKCTQGNWIISDLEELATVERGQDPFGIWDEEQNIRIASIDTQYATPEEIKANAHLIVAALKMYKELSYLRDIFETMGPGYANFVGTINSLLEEARGES